jgi:hypothetical protein
MISGLKPHMLSELALNPCARTMGYCLGSPVRVRGASDCEALIGVHAKKVIVIRRNTMADFILISFPSIKPLAVCMNSVDILN